MDAVGTPQSGDVMAVWDHLRHFTASVAAWFATSANWRGPSGVPELLWRQAELSAAVVVGAIVIGGGIGVVFGHTNRGGLLAVNAANVARAVPSLALLTLFAIIPWISLRGGGFLAAFLALVVLAIPPILTNTYVGMREVDADVRDAARAMGLTGGEMLRSVELPLAAPFIMAGIRTAAIEVVATSTLAAYVSYSDLGTPIISGLNTNDTVEAFAGAILVALLAAVVALALGVVQRVVTPEPQRRQRRSLAGIAPPRRPDGRGQKLTKVVGILYFALPPNRRIRTRGPCRVCATIPEEGSPDVAPTLDRSRCGAGPRPHAGGVQQ